MRLSFIDINMTVHFIDILRVKSISSTTIMANVVEVKFTMENSTVNCKVYTSTLNGIYKKLEVIGV